MADVASRDLRNRTRALLDRVASGESLTITVDGRPVAVLAPVSSRPRWLSGQEFTSRVVGSQADSALRGDVAALGHDSTSDLPFR
ncbi:MAG: type II toxin-antitoxin system prevent-host-death family antitoxin [Acidimicrobiia bacterium]|nr:type II toxin-antitoxin system prevent-host-death family antitoxin [Acidimicrobiia bacterium]